MLVIEIPLSSSTPIVQVRNAESSAAITYAASYFLKDPLCFLLYTQVLPLISKYLFSFRKINESEAFSFILSR